MVHTLCFNVQYIPRNKHTVFALLCSVVVIHWLIFPYSSGLLHWHYGNLTIAPVPAKQHWWIWINSSCEFIMNDCITTTKQSTTNPCAYFLGYTVHAIMYRSVQPIAARHNSLALTRTASRLPIGDAASLHNINKCVTRIHKNWWKNRNKPKTTNRVHIWWGILWTGRSMNSRFIVLTMCWIPRLK